MSYTNYNNVNVKIDSASFLAESVSIDHSASLSPNYLLNRKSSFNYVTEESLKGSIQISYPITGKDYLSNFISSEKSFSIDVGGLKIDKGYLSSYSFDLEQFQPIRITANIDFWGDINGSFSSSKNQENITGILTSSDVSFYHTGVNISDNILGISYSYSSNLDPKILAGQITPSDIRFTEKQTTLNLKTYSVGGGLFYSGAAASFNIIMGGQSYGFNGVFDTKKLNFDLGQKMTTELSFKQNLLGSVPIISSFTSPHIYGNLVTIQGQNLSTTTSVLFHPNVKSPKVIIDGDSQIRAELPMGSISGPITVINLGGETRTTSSISISSSIIA
jgi:hypothetical protein